MTAPIPPTQFAPGTEVLGYTIQRVLGRGGMGTVYLARQNSLDREVALKVLHPSRLKNPASISAFLREARAAAKLSHAHLVAVHDVLDDQPNGLYCYSMEYVPGTTAAEHVHQHGVMKRADGAVEQPGGPPNVSVRPYGLASSKLAKWSAHLELSCCMTFTICRSWRETSSAPFRHTTPNSPITTQREIRVAGTWTTCRN